MIAMSSPCPDCGIPTPHSYPEQAMTPAERGVALRQEAERYAEEAVPIPDAFDCPHGVVFGAGCKTCDALAKAYVAIRDRDKAEARWKTAEATLADERRCNRESQAYLAEQQQVSEASYQEAQTIIAGLEAERDTYRAGLAAANERWAKLNTDISARLAAMEHPHLNAADMNYKAALLAVESRMKALERKEEEK
jgi:hypothetical protein